MRAKSNLPRLLSLGLLIASPGLLAEVKVEVAPDKITLAPGQSHQFKATVTGATDAEVDWTREPAYGEIDPATGKYTAPEVSPSCKAETVEIIALSREDPKVSGKAKVTLFPDPKAKDDCRENFEASFYLGYGVDTFASSEFNGLVYANPNAAAGLTERAVGGFDFQYRLARFGKKHPMQLWIYGETVHGVRSADVDCSQEANKKFITCANTLGIPDNAADQLLRIIRNATTLEGFVGGRFEFLRLNKGGQHPANVYVKAQAGFIKVASRPGDAVDLHQFGIGAVATKGHFQGSYLEVGLGRNDLFIDGTNRKAHPWNRKMIDGYVSVDIAGPVRFFAQLCVDSDFGPRSDSVQSFIGFEFNLRKFSFGRN